MPITVLKLDTLCNFFSYISSLFSTGSTIYYDPTSGVFPLVDVGVVPGFGLSLAVTPPEGVFFAAVVFLVPVGKIFELELWSCFDVVAVVPVAGFADVVVVAVFAGPLFGSIFAFVVGVVVLAAGGLVAVVVVLVVGLFFLGYVFYGTFLMGSGFGELVVATGFLSVADIFESFLIMCELYFLFD